MKPSHSNHTSILVAHRDPLVQAGLCAALGEYSEFGVERKAAALGDERFEAQISRVKVFIADYDTAVAYLVDRARKAEPSGVSVLVVSASDLVYQIRQALLIGVNGYVMADCALDELVEAVRSVSSGRLYVSQRVGQRMAESVIVQQLTAREVDVLLHLADGLCNKQIANQLGIGLGTIKAHMRAIFGKLRVDNRTQALVVAERRGLLGPGKRSAGAKADEAWDDLAMAADVLRKCAVGPLSALTGTAHA